MSGGAASHVAVGLAAGLGLSVASNGIVARWSIGNLSDPIVLAMISVVLLAVAAVAALIPANHAASIQPASAIRTD
jgi:ABC-type antimicrobial peptide transport system permease subunit